MIDSMILRFYWFGYGADIHEYVASGFAIHSILLGLNPSNEIVMYKFLIMSQKVCDKSINVVCTLVVVQL